MFTLWSEQDYQFIDQETLELYVNGIVKLINFYGKGQGAVYDAVVSWVTTKTWAIEQDDFWTLDQLVEVEGELIKELLNQDKIGGELSAILGVPVQNFARSASTTYLNANGLVAPPWLSGGAGLVPVVGAVVIGSVISIVVLAALALQIITSIEESERYAGYLQAVNDALVLGIPMEDVQMISTPPETHSILEIPVVSSLGKGGQALLEGGGKALADMGPILMIGGGLIAVWAMLK